MADFLNAFTRNLSGYYGPAGVRILAQTKDAAGNAVVPDAGAVAGMHARIHLCNCFRQVWSLASPIPHV